MAKVTIFYNICAVLSILIPTYNYEVSELVSQIYEQCVNAAITFEIIIGDDGSDNTIYQPTINREHLKIHRNKSNLGRTETRQLLAQKSAYNWLLFLDADVLPVKENFIATYARVLKNSDADLAFGGFSYAKEAPPFSNILRWKYGTAKEDIPLDKRTKNPYKVIISANLLINKDLFLSVNKNLKGNYYGYDNIFSLDLKTRKANVAHIDNPVWHLGLEDNATYLRKKEQSAETVYRLYHQEKLNAGSNDLLKSFEFLQKTGFIRIYRTAFRQLKPLLRRNILGRKPSISLLNLYRLGYFCNLDVNEKR